MDFPFQVYFTITLTKDSLFKRNICHFGPTTLRATICSALLTMADVKPGDVVVDPMCGGGSIPIEGKGGCKVILIHKVVLGGQKKADGKWLNFWVKIYGINFFA